MHVLCRRYNHETDEGDLIAQDTLVAVSANRVLLLEFAREGNHIVGARVAALNRIHGARTKEYFDNLKELPENKEERAEEKSRRHEIVTRYQELEDAEVSGLMEDLKRLEQNINGLELTDRDFESIYHRTEYLVRSVVLI